MILTLPAANSPLRPLPDAYRNLASLLGAAAAALGLLGLSGWILGMPLLASIRSSYIPMAPITSIALACLGGLLLVHTMGFSQGPVGSLAAVISAILSAYGLIELVEYPGIPALSLEEWVFPDPPMIGAVPTGRMSPATAGLLLLSGAVIPMLFLRDRAGEHRKLFGDLAGCLGILVALTGAVFLLGYLHGAPLLYGTMTIPMAATTAIAFLLMGTGQVLAMGPDGFPSRLIAGPSARARLLRVFVSTTVGAVVAIDLMHVYVHGIFFEGNAILSGVATTVFAVMTGALIARVALKVGDGMDRSEEIRRRAEDRLRESEDLFRDLVEHSQDFICTHDLEGRILSANPWAASVLGYDPEELLRMSFRDLLVPEMRHEFGRYLDEIRTHGTARGLVWVQATNGDRRLLEYTNTLRTEGLAEPIVRGMAHDVTERRREEEEKRNLEEQVRQTQKMESLGVLAGGIAHDFNNILMAVLGHAELALNEISPMSPARGNLAEIATAARRAADLCRQMLAYAGKSSIALERVVLRDLVEEMAHLLKTAISKKAILNLNLERGLPPIEADPSQIRQVVMNLIINASEAIGDRSGVITVSVGATRCDEEYLRRTELREDLAPGLYVHLEVTDTGSGMDAETRSRIFEPFFSTKFAGRGLGLAAVLGIVRAHKGALKVYSEPGKGTTFKILFPALEAAGKGIRTGETSPPADWRGKGTILLVDDEESLVALGSRMLEHLGLTVLTAADGLQAVERYRERGKEIDLVLMDLTMPHMDGAEAFGELRRLNPDVRVVLASGYSHEDVSSRFAGKGLDGVLQKPYTLAKLRESLAGLMPKRREGKE